MRTESEGGLAVDFRLPVKYFDALCFSDLTLHNARVLYQRAVK